VKIGIDARFLTHPQKGGFKTYTENLCMALSEVDSGDEYVLYLDRRPREHTRLPSGPNISHRIVRGTAPVIGQVWREQISLPSRVRKDRLDLFHSPCLTSPLLLACPRVVTIHDMIWRHPARTERLNRFSVLRTLMRWYNRSIPLLAARNAAVILTVSEASKDEIVRHMGIPPSRVIVTPEAAPRSFKRINDATQIKTALDKHRLTRPFILSIGSSDPRKNISTLLHAYSLMAPSLRERCPLVIILTHSALAGNFTQQARSLGVAEQVRFLNCLPDEDMVLLYNAAALFVFPSLEEGFGLPVLEAMACGTPVIASNNSSFPEVAGEAAVLIEARNTDAISSAMSAILTQETLQEKLRADGINHASRFSWERCAVQTIMGYKVALQNRKNASSPR
jgi:glycosyltransferase involved in cell wall biosynthesis